MAKLFKYSQDLLQEVIKSNIETFGYITTNTAELFWNTKEVQHKVKWGMNKFDITLSKKQTANYDCVLTSEDIRSELYETFVSSILKFNFAKKKVFLSYFNMAINRRVDRIFDEFVKQPVAKKVMPIDMTTENDNDFFLHDLKNSKSFTNSELTYLKEILDNNLTEFNPYQKRVLDKYKRYLQRKQLKKKSKLNTLNYLNMYSYKGMALKNPKTNEILVCTDGITFSTDNLPNGDFALKEGLEYEITIKKIKPIVVSEPKKTTEQPKNENTLW